jgi:RNA polymerase sigma-70 factor (ECF subfamily)
MIKDDCTIVKDIQEGKYASFEILYHKYFPKMYSFIMIKSGGNVALTQDVTSETFLKAFEHIGDFVCKEGGSFSARLYRIAYTTFIDHIKQKTPDVSLDEKKDVKEQADMIDLYQKKSQTESIIQFLETLGTEKKDLFLLRIWEEMNYEEIAEIMGKSAESCRQEFSRTMKKVQEKFKNFV